MHEPPILDADRLTLVTRGNKALADEFLEALIVEASELLERSKALRGSDDRVAVGDIAHTLKGMATELGAQRLRAVAVALEAETDPVRWPEHVERAYAAVAELRLQLLR